MPTKQWIATHRERYLETRRVAANRHGRTLKGKWTKHKQTAKARGIQNDLTFEQFVRLIANPCHWCGGKLPETRGGLDRLDSSIGYSLSNCVPCCRRCNVIKMDMAPNDFISHIRKILNHQGIIQ